MPYQSEMYYLPVHPHHHLNHHHMNGYTNGYANGYSNGYTAEDDDQPSGNGAVAKLLKDDLNWASKYLRSNSISRGSSVGRSSASPSRSLSVGRDVPDRSSNGSEVYSMYSRSSVAPSSPTRTDLGSYDMRYRSGTPESQGRYSVERRYSRPLNDFTRLPTPTRSFESKYSTTRSYHRNSIDMKPPTPEVSDTRRRLRRLISQSRQCPQYYN